MIPLELQRIPQWVCAKNDSKAPFDPVNGRAASVARPETWGRYEQAVKRVDDGLADNVGFVFHQNGIVGIDIDDGWSDGFVSPKAAEIIRRCGSYTEVSRSGRGFHILLRGRLPFDGRNNRAGVEVYQTGRYFIMTGKTLIYTDIIDNQPAIDWLVETHFPDMREGGDKSARRRVYTPEWSLPVDGSIPLRPDYPPIPAGTRNISLTSIGGAMWSNGYSKRDIRRELDRINRTACSPKLPDGEVAMIVASVTRYKR